MHAYTLRLAAIMSVAMAPMSFSAPANAQEKMSEAEAPENAMTNKDWWPDRLDLSPLRQEAPDSNPYGPDCDYAAEFNTLDLATAEAFLADVRYSWNGGIFAFGRERLLEELRTHRPELIRQREAAVNKGRMDGDVFQPDDILVTNSKGAQNVGKVDGVSRA